MGSSDSTKKVDWDDYHEKNKIAILYKGFIIGHVVKWFNNSSDFVVRTLHNDSSWSGKFESFEDAVHLLVDRYKSNHITATIPVEKHDQDLSIYEFIDPCVKENNICYMSIDGKMVHPYAKELEDSQEDGYPSGDTIRIYCPICKKEWTEEIPQ